ncbi:MAG: TolC family protein, partial [Chitinophagia bacterium]|nr:TolC family protein [Chitinophagia bacterium]
MLLLPGISNTQDAWTLEKCVVHAIQANISAAQADLAVDRAKINLSQARQTRMPNLSGNSNLNWNFGRTVDPTTNEFITETFFSNGFSLSTGMSIYNGKQISNSIRQSAVDLEAARNDAQQTRQTIALQVASNFLNVLFAKENISISERQLELNRQQLDQTQSLIDAGARAASEILNLEAQVATSEQALIVSMNNFDITMLQLKQILR